MNRFIRTVELTAGYFIGLLAIITFVEAVLRYVFTTHIPDGFVLAQMMQGIAICWGIATTTYADRHVTVDILYTLGGRAVRRAIDVTAYTLNLAFLATFGVMITFKVYDILLAGELSAELRVPIWMGYILASVGVLAAVVMAAARWWQMLRDGR